MEEADFSTKWKEFLLRYKKTKEGKTLEAEVLGELEGRNTYFIIWVQPDFLLGEKKEQRTQIREEEENDLKRRRHVFVRGRGGHFSSWEEENDLLSVQVARVLENNKSVGNDFF